MEEKMKRNEPSEVVLLDTVKAINALDAVRIGIGAEDFDMLSLCSPYMPPLVCAFNELIELAATSLGFQEMSVNGIKKFTKGSHLNDDYFEIFRDEFTRMIYLCRNDTVMLHHIFECFVKHDKKAMATVAKDFIYSL
jgi:hypothetical protein